MTLGLRDPKVYMELLKTFPPRPITSEEELLATQRVIDDLLDQAELTPDQRDYLNVLGTLVYEYEQQHDPMPEVHGAALLKALLAERNIDAHNLLPIFKSETTMSAILNEQQELTVVQIQELATFFGLSPILFLSPSR